MNPPATVVVADDHPIVRSGIVGLLDSHDEIDVLAEAADGREALAAALRLRPDVVVIDLRMPGTDGVEATTAIQEQCPEVAVLVLTTFDTDEAIVRAIDAGAAGYLLKDAPTEQLLDAVRRAAAGETVLAARVSRRLVERMRGTTTDALTAHEIEVLRHVADGNTSAETAQSLHISTATVKTYLLHVDAELGVSDRAAAVAQGYEQGILAQLPAPARSPTPPLRGHARTVGRQPPRFWAPQDLSRADRGRAGPHDRARPCSRRRGPARRSTRRSKSSRPAMRSPARAAENRSLQRRRRHR